MSRGRFGSGADLSDYRCGQLIELMRVCDYSRSMSFLDLGPRIVTYEN